MTRGRRAFGRDLGMKRNAPNVQQRSNALASRQKLKMARSPQAFVRGTTKHFYRWLGQEPTVSIPAGPPIWICGDCHFGNFGPLGSLQGDIRIEIRDFDQTVIGNPAHDLIRLALSLATAIRDSNLSGLTIIDMLEQMCVAYGDALASGEGLAQQVPDAVLGAFRAAQRRDCKDLAFERVKGLRWFFPKSKRFWPLTPEELTELQRLLSTQSLLTTILGEKLVAETAIELTDAAYWVKGCSSLGLFRIAALLRIKGRRSGSWRLVDIKEGVAPLCPRDATAVLPASHAERVVSGARMLSPELGMRMAPATVAGKSVFLRELLPQDLKLELASLTSKEATGIARYLAFILGTAHARQLEFGARSAWLLDLRGARSAAIDAPSWLWKAVIALMTVHQQAYLEHCREAALELTRMSDEEKGGSGPTRAKVGNTLLFSGRGG